MHVIFNEYKFVMDRIWYTSSVSMMLWEYSKITPNSQTKYPRFKLEEEEEKKKNKPQGFQ